MLKTACTLAGRCPGLRPNFGRCWRARLLSNGQLSSRKSPLLAVGFFPRWTAGGDGSFFWRALVSAVINTGLRTEGTIEAGASLWVQALFVGATFTLLGMRGRCPRPLCRSSGRLSLCSSPCGPPPSSGKTSHPVQCQAFQVGRGTVLHMNLPLSYTHEICSLSSIFNANLQI